MAQLNVEVPEILKDKVWFASLVIGLRMRDIVEYAVTHYLDNVLDASVKEKIEVLMKNSKPKRVAEVVTLE